jgi:hypothetical protein
VNPALIGTLSLDEAVSYLNTDAPTLIANVKVAGGEMVDGEWRFKKTRLRGLASGQDH